MGKNTFSNLKAHGAGKSIPSSNSPSTKKKTKIGKVIGATKAPLPDQKANVGTGIKGRGTSRAS